MRLTSKGRTAYAVIAILSLAVSLWVLAEREWLVIGIPVLVLLLFGIPALTGRDRSIDQAKVPRWLAPLFTPDAPPANDAP